MWCIRVNGYINGDLREFLLFDRLFLSMRSISRICLQNVPSLFKSILFSIWKPEFDQLYEIMPNCLILKIVNTITTHAHVMFMESLTILWSRVFVLRFLKLIYHLSIIESAPPLLQQLSCNYKPLTAIEKAIFILWKSPQLTILILALTWGRFEDCAIPPIQIKI